MRSCFIFAVVLATTGPALAGAATLSVDPSGAGGFASITDALAASASGDVIEVAAGTYTEDLDFAGKEVTVLSVDGVGAATIAGTGAGPVVSFVTAEGPGAVLEGFVITGGDATGTYLGGGVHVSGSGPTLRDLEIRDNVAWIGGGMLLAESDATLQDVWLHDNVAELDDGGSWGRGGGLYAFDCDVVIDGLIAEDNSAVRGGGLMLGDCVGTLQDITLSSNAAERGAGFSLVGGAVTIDGATIDGNAATIVGGGLYLSVDSGLTLSDAVITANTAPNGAGGRILDSSPTLEQITFDGNIATDNGGALLIDVSSGAATPSLNSCLFDGNEAAVGGAILIDEGAPSVLGCVFQGNTASNLGGAIYVAEASATSIAVCVFDGNTSASDGGGVRYQGGVGHTITASIFTGNAATNGAAAHVGFGASVTVEHCTIVGNTATSGGSLRVTSDSSLVVRNSIVALPQQGAGITAASGSTWTIEFNDVWNTVGPEYGGSLPDLTGSFGNLSVDPEFVDYTSDGVYNDNLHLALGSPCIDAGDPVAADEPDGTAVDMGAYGGQLVGLWTTLPAAGAPGDDDDSTGDDDDSTGDDDDSTGDDDDDSTGTGDDDDATGDDDDDSGDDDDSTSSGDDDDLFGDDDDQAGPPSTGGCSCSSATGHPSGWWLVSFAALARRRRA